MTEAEARQVLLLQAVESAAAHPAWSAEDAAWATRLARQDAGDDAPPQRFIVVRARHALQRLLPRDAAARRWIERRAWRPLWPLLAALFGFVVGAVVDHVGAPHRVDLLAPPVWAVIAWNLVVYVGLLVPHPPTGLRRLLARRWHAQAAPAALLWARHATPLSLLRAALVLHAAAAALALGLIAGLYLRGLVLDYRAGWQSTFLDANVVQAVLNTALAPASMLTGIAVPDVAPLRVTPAVAASASAAPWIHLYATMLALFVVLPRLVLAALAGWRAHRLAVHFPLPLDAPYFERLQAQGRGGRTSVLVLPHAAAIGAQAALGLRALLAPVYGDTIDLRIGAVTPYGAEDAATGAADGRGAATLCIAVVDLGALPEEEVHGRYLDALRAAGPVLLVADAAAFQRRFSTLPARLAERVAAWQQLAGAHGVGCVVVDLESPDVVAASQAVQAALAR